MLVSSPPKGGTLTRRGRENVAVIVRAFSPRIVENDVEMALVVGLRPTLV
ncbi:MAG: hypothetical protein GX456_17305 [Verrucomicrobia bacterium]|nr:hypothetical protein [Verrucomicrobiota bacterium]